MAEKKARRRKPAIPAVMTCERCRTMFALKLPLCKCPKGPYISEETASKYL